MKHDPFKSAARCLLLAAALTLCGTALWAKKPAHPLSPGHKKWLEEDVVYIISKVERNVFLHDLKSDLDRDRFIDSFWAARDPSPGTPENEYKVEHYRRISYANSKFIMEGAPGWRTDRGKIYILLGQPAQILDWTADYHIYPVELWFYTNRNHPSLYSAFYVMFWEREGFGGYRLYSPYNDGIQRLTHGTNINSKRMSYEYMRSINAELARAALCLIPSEPVDLQDFSPSLTSDMLINKIITLPEEEAPTGYLRLYISDPSKLKGKVDTRLIYSSTPTTLNLTAFPTLDAEGNALVHWAFKIYPKELSVARYQDRYYFSLEVGINLSDAEDKVIFRRSQEVVRYFNEDEFERVKGMCLQFQDKLGVVPGKYRMDLLIFNRVNSQTYTQSRTFEVPDLPAAAPAVGPLMLTDSFGTAAAGDSVESRCFSFFNYRFSPLTERKVSMTERLGVLFHLFWPPEEVKAQPGKQLSLEYRLLPERSETPSKVIMDNTVLGKLDAKGTLLTFKQIPLTEIMAGRFSLVIVVKDAEGAVLASGSIPFFLDPTRKTPTLTLFSDKLGPDAAGIYDYQRSLILEKSGDAAGALRFLERAVLKNPDATEPVVALVRQKLGTAEPAALAELLARVRENADFPPEGHLYYARALTAQGKPSDSDAALDAFVKTGRGTRSEYLEAAALYEKNGNTRRSEDIRKQVEGMGGTK